MNRGYGSIDIGIFIKYALVGKGVNFYLILILFAIVRGKYVSSLKNIEVFNLRAFKQIGLWEKSVKIGYLCFEA